MNPETNPNEKQPKRYLSLEFENRIDTDKGINLGLLSAIGFIDSANRSLFEDSGFKSNAEAWWELDYNRKHLSFLVRDVVPGETVNPDPELLELANKVLEDTAPKIKAFREHIRGNARLYDANGKDVTDELIDQLTS